MWNIFFNLSKRLTEPNNVKGENIMKAKVVKVNILGQDYVVRSAAGQKYLEQVAKYVDGKMEEIKASGIDDSQQLRIAILAAMNITDELFAYKKIGCWSIKLAL